MKEEKKEQEKGKEKQLHACSPKYKGMQTDTHRVGHAHMQKQTAGETILQSVLIVKNRRSPQ